MNSSNQRETWVDVLRAFACACVLLVHSPAAYDGITPGKWILGPSTYVLMSWGVYVFFMISGALLLGKKQELVPFYKKRFGRVLFPTVFWSFVYIFFDALIDGTFTWSSTITKILMIPFSTQAGLLWFMYVLLGIYLVVPILSKWLVDSSKKDVEIVLAIWGISLLLPFFKLLNEGCNELVSPLGPLYHFYGFLGYALLGFYLKKYNTWSNASWQFILLLTISLGFPVLVFLTGVLPISILDGSNNILKVALTASAFIFFKNLKYNDSFIVKISCVFAKYSFGIYLSHILFMKPLKIALSDYHINYLVQMPITALIVGVISFGFVWLLTKLPFSKYIIG